MELNDENNRMFNEFTSAISFIRQGENYTRENTIINEVQSSSDNSTFSTIRKMELLWRRYKENLQQIFLFLYGINDLSFDMFGVLNNAITNRVNDCDMNSNNSTDNNINTKIDHSDSSEITINSKYIYANSLTITAILQTNDSDFAQISSTTVENSKFGYHEGLSPELRCDDMRRPLCELLRSEPTEMINWKIESFWYILLYNSTSHCNIYINNKKNNTNNKNKNNNNKKNEITPLPSTTRERTRYDLLNSGRGCRAQNATLRSLMAGLF